MGEVHQHAYHVELFRQPAGVVHVLGMNSARVTLAFELEDLPYPVNGRIQISRAIDRQHERELFVGERVVLADTALLHHEELRVVRRFGKARFAGEHGRVLGNQLAVEIAVHPQRVLDLFLFFRARHVAADRFQRRDGRVVDLVEYDQ